MHVASNTLSLCVCSVNLMTCMGSLTAIVKQRPVYMKSVVQGFESLHGLLIVLSVCVTECISLYVFVAVLNNCRTVQHAVI